MKRKTYRQKVVAIYPTATLWNGYDVMALIDSTRADGAKYWPQRMWLSVGKNNPNDAWKDAWQYIQETMLWKLEQ